MFVHIGGQDGTPEGGQSEVRLMRSVEGSVNVSRSSVQDGNFCTKHKERLLPCPCI